MNGHCNFRLYNLQSGKFTQHLVVFRGIALEQIGISVNKMEPLETMSRIMMKS